MGNRLFTYFNILKQKKEINKLMFTDDEVGSSVPQKSETRRNSNYLWSLKQ